MGHFEGDLVTRWLDGGRLMELTQPFGYVDDEGLAWPVPEGAQTDGASIPRFLWTVIGGPFEDLYRSAAVIHDYYCDVRTRGWRAVHLMFYEAMIAAGVAISKAKMLYFGVLLGGPRWDDQTIHNANLPHTDSVSPRLKYHQLSGSIDELDIIQPNITSDEFMLVSKNVADMNITDLEIVADNKRKDFAKREVEVMLSKLR